MAAWLLALGGGTSVMAQSTPERAVSLDEALHLAASAPPRVKAALARTREAEAQARLERGAYLPRLTGEAGTLLSYDQRPYAIAAADGTTSVQRLAATSQSVAANGTLAWTATDFGLRAKRTDAADASARVEAARARTEQTEAMREAASLYVDLIAARALVDDGELTVKRRELEVEAVDKLVRGGVRPSVDKLRAEVELLAARAALVERTLRARALASALAVALGFPPDHALAPTELEDARLDGMLAHGCPALERRAELEAARENETASERKAQAARAERRPTLDVEVSAQATRYKVLSGIGISGPIMGTNAGLVLRWSGLDASVWRKAQVGEAAVSAATYAREGAELSVRNEVAQAAYAVAMGRAALAQAEQLSSAAVAARDAQQARYRAGVGSLLELLDAEAVEQASRARRIEARRSYDAARLVHAYSCGVLSD